MTLLETAPTEFIESAGITFAYRRLGTRNGTPLVLLQHFTGNMDSWDPAVVNALAEDRPVIVFDNTGVGKSSGSTPDNVAQMAVDARRFMSALGLTGVDQPVLVVCGSDDTMVPDRNAYFMFKHLRNAQLILYPDSGYGALFQYPERFVTHVTLFLTES